MDSFHGWYDDRYLSKMLYSTIPPHSDDLKGNVMDLEFLCFSVLYLIMSYPCVGTGSFWYDSVFTKHLSHVWHE